MSVNILAVAAIIAGAVSLWQPRHSRIAVGVFLILYGVIELGIVR